MRAVIWLVEDTWEATLAEADTFVPAGAEITLLYVVATDAETVMHGARAGLLGRRPAPPPRHEAPASKISEEAARGLLEQARARWHRPARIEIRRGRVEREVVAAADGADLLVMARDGDPRHPGPHSIGPHTRFVFDHVPCRVLLVWPGEPGG